MAPHVSTKQSNSCAIQSLCAIWSKTRLKLYSMDKDIITKLKYCYQRGMLVRDEIWGIFAKSEDKTSSCCTNLFAIVQLKHP